MLSAQKRIPKELFPTFLLGADYFSTPHFIIRVNKTSQTPRFAVVVSKKLASNAVKRNDLRRKIYSIIASIYSNTTPALIAIYPNKSVFKLSKKLFSNELTAALAKAGVITVR